MKKLEQKAAAILLAVSMVLCTCISAYAADDYPEKYQRADRDFLKDEWNFLNRECTSFVAWCLNNRNGVKFHNHYNGVQWGHARDWGNAARSCGITVDMKPAKGSVYWTDAGYYGHVAWVSAVDGNNVHIEEYNFNGTGTYHERTIHVNDASGYIHIKDMDSNAHAQPQVPHGQPMTTGGVQKVRDGDYHIVTAVDESKCLDIAGPSKDNGANAQIWPSVDRDNQVFTVRFLGNGFYEIQHKYSGKFLDVCGASLEMDTNVRQWEGNGNDAQKWVIHEVDDGAYYTIQSKCNGYYLDVEDGNPADCTNVRVHEGNGSKAQKWRFIPWGKSVGKTVSDGDYQIFPWADQNKVLSAERNGTKNGTNACLNTNLGDSRYVFTVKYLGDGYYYLINKSSNLLLDLSAGGLTLSSNVQLWQKNNEEWQKWIIKPTGDGYYNVISKWSGLYLDLVNGGTANGTNINTWVGNGTTNQKWRFVKWTKPASNSGSTTKPNTGTNTQNGNQSGNNTSGSSGTGDNSQGNSGTGDNAGNNAGSGNNHGANADNDGSLNNGESAGDQSGTDSGSTDSSLNPPDDFDDIDDPDNFDEYDGNLNEGGDEGEGDDDDDDGTFYNVEWNVSSATMQIGKSTKKIRAEASEDDDIEKYISSDMSVITVSEEGVIRAVGVGKAVVRVVSEHGCMADVSIKVQKGAVKTRKITVSSKNVELRAGKTYNLKAEAEPITSSQKLKYQSSNPKVAAVNSKGKIKAKKQGTAIVKVKSGNKTVKVNVAVYA